MNAGGTYPCPICWARLRFGDGPSHMGEHRRDGWTQTCCAECRKFVWCKEADGRYLCAEDLPAEVTR